LRKAGDTVLQVLSKMHQYKTRKMRAVINDIRLLQQTAIKSLQDTVLQLEANPLFSPGTVRLQLEAQTVRDGKTINDLQIDALEAQVELVEERRKNSVLKACLWEYERKFEQANNFVQ
jgi:hypothetical protein